MGKCTAKFFSTQILNTPFPLPPLAEQTRIVKRVNEATEQIRDLQTKLKQQTITGDRLARHHQRTLTKGDATPNEIWEQLQGELPLLLERPDRIEAFRGTVLQLAVRGKLTEQNPDIEPATALLDRIRAERDRLVKEKKIRKPKKLPPVDAAKVPFELPKGWVWVRLGEVHLTINNGISSGSHNTVGVGKLHLRPMNVTASGKIDLNVLKYTEKEADIHLKKDDILFNNTNSNALVGKSAVVKEDTDWLYSNHMTRLQFPSSMLLPEYVHVWFNYLFETRFFQENCRQYINQASINLTFLTNDLLFPIAPLAEQTRIVERVQTMTTLLDELTTQTRAQRAAADDLLGAVLGELV